MKLKIEWSPLALSQLDEISKFYTKRNLSDTYSKRLRKKVRETVTSIRRSPFLGERLPGSRRRFTIENFVLIYQIQDNTVQILSFRDGRREPEE
jgi:addiction module RelE/StbE family toxin